MATGFCVLLRRAGPSAGSLIALTSLLIVVGLSILAFSPWPHWPVAAAGTSLETASSEAASVEVSGEAPSLPAADSGARASTGSVTVEPSAQPSDGSPPRQSATATLFWQTLMDELSGEPLASETPSWRWSAVVAIVFFVGAGAGLLWVLVGLVAVRSYRRQSRTVCDAALLELVDLLRAEMGCRRRIEVRESKGLLTATTFGWRRPVILLPGD